MEWYVLRRIAWAVVATWIGVTLAFGLWTAAPNPGADAAAAQAAAQGLDPEQARERYLERRGLNRPVHVRYMDYMVDIATFDWGYSISEEQPVTEVIEEGWVYSAQYFIPAILISIVFGYGIGLYTALNQYSISDYAGSFIAYFGISIPNFWFAIMLILVFGVWTSDAELFGISLDWINFRTYYQTDFPTWSGRNARQLVLPVIVLSTASVASQMRYSRTQALEYARTDFVKTARAKGASDWRVLTRHIFRVALVPLSTILIVQVLAVLFAGSFVIEQIFQIPGLGVKYLDAISQNDTRLLLVMTLIPIFIAVIGNLLQDLAYVFLDPRIDYGDR
jgi:peptide/nickel transport system permease protein